jgi:branched-chain amino acid transport system ATP-binding protein
MTASLSHVSEAPSGAPLLEVQSLGVSYGGLVAVDGADFAIAEGEVLGIAGPNGAGKSSLMRAVAGLVKPSRGRIRYGGEAFADGAAGSARGPRWAVRHGLVIVPEGRQLFGEMSVEENLRFGAYVAGSDVLERDLDRVFALFPKLRQRRAQVSATLSGGEQQMVAIGRALMARPRLLLLDEMSLGLAPAVAAEVCEALIRLRDEARVTMIVVDESLKRLARIASRVLFMSRGRIQTELAADGLLVDEARNLLARF